MPQPTTKSPLKFAYLLIPFTPLLPEKIKYPLLYIPLLLKAYAIVFAFPCSTILLTNSAPSLLVLGTLNGVAVSISALGRATGPAIIGWAFTVGIETGYGILAWWILAGFAVVAAVPVWWLVEGEGFGGKADEDARREEEEEEEGRGEEADETTPLNGEGVRKVRSHGSAGSRRSLHRRISEPGGEGGG